MYLTGQGIFDLWSILWKNAWILAVQYKSLPSHKEYITCNKTGYVWLVFKSDKYIFVM